MNPPLNTTSPTFLNSAEWRALYQAAILETNKSLIHERLSAAEKAMLVCDREVFCNSDEKEELEDALYLLRAYKNALHHTEAA